MLVLILNHATQVRKILHLLRKLRQSITKKDIMQKHITDQMYCLQ